MSGDPVFQNDDGTWAFWFECWSEHSKNYASESDARDALSEYVREYLGP